MFKILTSGRCGDGCATGYFVSANKTCQRKEQKKKKKKKKKNLTKKL